MRGCRGATRRVRQLSAAVIDARHREIPPSRGRARARRLRVADAAVPPQTRSHTCVCHTHAHSNGPLRHVRLDGDGLARVGEDRVAHLNQHLHGHLEARLLGGVGGHPVAVEHNLALEVLVLGVDLAQRGAD